MDCYICSYDIEVGEFYYRHSDGVMEICEHCYRDVQNDPDYTEEERQEFTKFFKEQDDD